MKVSSVLKVLLAAATAVISLCESADNIKASIDEVKSGEAGADK